MGAPLNELLGQLGDEENVILALSASQEVRHYLNDDDAELILSLSKGLLERAPGKDDNWVESNGGLPPAIEDMADSLHRERGMTISRAIATAVSQAKKLAAKGNAKYVKAVAQWEAMKAKAKAKKAAK